MRDATAVVPRLESLLGSDRVRVVADSEGTEYAVDGVAPRAVALPQSAEEAAQLVRFALSENLALLPCGSCSKLELGVPPERYEVAVDVTGLQSIAHYDAADLTLGVDAGVPLRNLAGILSEHKQFLPLAVPCFETSTVGGAVASGIDSALRLQYGTARDFLIGAEFVDGTGQICKSGGRVVKNVTGYDLHKLLAGSLGTLGVITRLNFRTFPLAEASSGTLATFDKLEAALQFSAAIQASRLPLNNFELISPETAAILSAILSQLADAPSLSLTEGKWCAYSSFEGPEALLRRINRELQDLAAQNAAPSCEQLDSSADETLGGMLRESFEWLRWAAPHAALLRITSLKIDPTFLQELGTAAETHSLRGAVLLRPAGIIYFALLAKDDQLGQLEHAALEAVRRIQAKGANAKLLHAPQAVKRAASPLIRTTLNLDMEKRVKQAFDPHNLFAPGRIVGAA